MEKTDFKEFSKHLTGIAETLDASLSSVKVQIYFQALEDISIGDIKKALGFISRTSKFFPKPVEIREAVFGKLEDRALVAVELISEARRSISGYASVCFEDPIIHVLIENFGGWEELTALTKEEWKWVKKDFIKQYPVFAGRTTLADVPERLKGIHEKSAVEPWPEDKVALVGDIQKIEKWKTVRALEWHKPKDKVHELVSSIIPGVTA